MKTSTSPWRSLKVFTSTTMPLAVEVSGMTSRNSRSYSVRVGEVTPTGVKYHIGVGTHLVDGFKVKVRTVSQELVKLLAQAEEWIAEEEALYLDLDIEGKIARELVQANQGKPVAKVTGKTAKKKARGLVSQQATK
jgi:hypothetical protein